MAAMRAAGSPTAEPTSSGSLPRTPTGPSSWRRRSSFCGSAPSSNTCRLLARDHAAPEPTLALGKATQPCCGQVRTLAWCSRPRSSTALQDGAPVIRTLVRFLDRRSGTTPLIRKTLRYLFPDHWSFLLGEVALYSFVVLVATGIYLTLFYEDSTAKVVYHGPYAPLQGQEMTHAYRSVLDLSTTVKAGLLMRQTHHWAADVFVAAIVLHLVRIFFTGAYRKPRELTYVIGILMLFISLLEGYLGYSLGDDLLSGMGLAIGYAVALSIPVVGANLALAIWGHQFPGDPSFWSRMYIAHVLILPLVIGGLIGALRLVPGFDVVIGNRTVVPNPFWGGALFPLVVMGLLLAWPWVERRVTGDRRVHNVLDRPRDAPWRSAIGAAVWTWVVLVFMAGSADRVFVWLGISYSFQIWAYRVAVFVLPVVVLF